MCHNVELMFTMIPFCSLLVNAPINLSTLSLQNDILSTDQVSPETTLVSINCHTWSKLTNPTDLNPASTDQLGATKQAL